MCLASEWKCQHSGDSYKHVHDAGAYVASYMYYERDTSVVVLSDGIVSEQLLFVKLATYLHIATYNA